MTWRTTETKARNARGRGFNYLDTNELFSHFWREVGGFSLRNFPSFSSFSYWKFWVRGYLFVCVCVCMYAAWCIKFSELVQKYSLQDIIFDVSTSTLWSSKLMYFSMLYYRTFSSMNIRLWSYTTGGVPYQCLSCFVLNGWGEVRLGKIERYWHCGIDPPTVFAWNKFLNYQYIIHLNYPNLY